MASRYFKVYIEQTHAKSNRSDSLQVKRERRRERKRERVRERLIFGRSVNFNY